LLLARKFRQPRARTLFARLSFPAILPSRTLAFAFPNLLACLGRLRFSRLLTFAALLTSARLLPLSRL